MFYNNILLIDDDADDREIFETALRRVSTEVGFDALPSAIDALQFLRQGNLADVIFLDLNMPIMNGLEFLAEIKQDVALQSIPVIVFSTSGSSRSVSQSMALGATDHITKPYQIQQLVAILERLL